MRPSDLKPQTARTSVQIDWVTLAAVVIGAALMVAVVLSGDLAELIRSFDAQPDAGEVFRRLVGQE